MSEIQNKFDESTFDDTAKAVFAMNSSSREKYDTWQDVRSFMETMAYRYAISEDSAYFSTGGFVLTTFKTDFAGGKTRHIVANVSAYCARKFVDEQNDKVDAAIDRFNHDAKANY